MSQTSIEALRRWFLGLSQLWKTVVFGGLGLVSGWVTTIAFVVLRNEAESAVALTAAGLSGGLAFGILVVRPMTVLGFDPPWRQIVAIPAVAAIHPLSFLIGIEWPSVAPSTEPEVRFLIRLVTGKVSGGLLAITCVPWRSSREGVVIMVAMLATGAAAGLLGGIGRLALPGPIPVTPKLQEAYGTALVMVSLHTVVAVCLSLRKWPKLVDAFCARPPLDDPAKLPA